MKKLEIVQKIDFALHVTFDEKVFFSSSAVVAARGVKTKVFRNVIRNFPCSPPNRECFDDKRKYCVILLALFFSASPLPKSLLEVKRERERRKKDVKKHEGKRVRG